MTFFESKKPVFNRYVLGNAPVKQLATRFVSCEYGSRRVTRTEIDGTITVIAGNYHGRQLNSPNDVIVKSDGSIWFTDPHYGIMTDYEGYRAERHYPCHVYRIDPDTGAMDAVVTSLNCPNGLALSPDETRRYVADTGRMFGSDSTAIHAFDLNDKGLPGSGRVFHSIKPGAADGFRLDTDGNLWSSAADSVHCVSPEGEILGKIMVPEVVSNVCFGGRRKHQLFITATTSIYAISLNLNGV